MARLAFFVAMALAATLPEIARADPSRESVAAPVGAIVSKVHAVGAQVYECKADGRGGLAWQFREPVATLMRDGQTVGRHFAGPTWEARDGSSIKGRVVAQAPGETPDDVAWLKLAVAEHGGAGEMAAVSVVQRIATVGGAKSGPCRTEGDLLAVPYAADYVFSR